jgi:type IV secretion system protein VirB4
MKDTPAPLVCGGSGAEPFYPPTHLGGVANQLIIGPTGTGKSALLGALVAAVTALPGVRIVWLDLDYSSFVLAHALEADYRELTVDESSPLCPLEFLNDEIGMSWLFDWLSRLFARWQILLDERQAADLTRALTLAQSQGIRSITEFFGLVQDSRLRGVLSHYAAGGKWGHIFGGKASTGGATAPLTVSEMRGLVALGDRAAAPATELILHGVENNMGARPCFIYVDEAWRMLSDEISRDWLYDAIRTLRKRNAGITLATQSLTEIANSPYRDLLLESCPGKIFLPNPEAKGDYVREAYLKLGLSEKQIAIVAAATPRKEYFFHCAQGRRLFTLDLGPVALALCAATDHQDVAQARALLEQHGAPGFLNAWLATRANGANRS